MMSCQLRKLIQAFYILGVALSLSSCGFEEYKNGAGNSQINQSKSQPTSASSPAPAVSPGVTPTAGASLYSRVNSEILVPKCIVCHNGAEAGAPDFRTYDAIKNAAGVITPKNPDASSLYNQVQAGLMPLGGPPLSADEVSLIREWIESGALESDSGEITPAPSPSASSMPAPTPTPTSPPKENPKPVVVAPVQDKRATFKRVNAEILQPMCVKCHGAGARISYVDYATLIATKSVVPKNANRSLLVRAVRTGYMPLVGPALTPEQLSLVVDWIDGGALNH